MNIIKSSEKHKNKLLTLLDNIKQISNNNDIKIEDILNNEYFVNLIILPQQKATIRGNLFNKYVFDECCKYIDKQYIKQEYKHESYAEILDLYISYNNKELCIYNQIDLWNGGEQLNRCDKYLNNPDKNILCIVLSKPTYKTNSKAYKLITPNLNKHIIWFSNIGDFLTNYFK